MDNIKFNEIAKTSNDTFFIDDKKGYEIFDHIYSRLISIDNVTLDNFNLAKEINILQKKFIKTNEFLYSIYSLGFLIRSFIDRQVDQLTSRLNELSEVKHEIH